MCLPHSLDFFKGLSPSLLLGRDKDNLTDLFGIHPYISEEISLLGNEIPMCMMGKYCNG